jgi:hypothetical protein
MGMDFPVLGHSRCIDFLTHYVKRKTAR